MNYNYHVIAIGSSAGGLAPLKEIVSGLSEDINAAIIIVPHISKDRNSNLDLILSKATRLPIVKITEDTKVEKGKVFVLGEGAVLTIKDQTLTLRPRTAFEKINKAIDIFFSSLSEEVKDKAIGIILSGAGYDGIEGAKKIENEKGIVIVQKPESAQFPLMPAALIANDHPDYILTPEEIIKKVTDRVAIKSAI